MPTERIVTVFSRAGAQLMLSTLALCACESEPRTAPISPNIGKAFAVAFEAEASELSDNDIRVIARIGELKNRWNDSSATLVRGYLDPTVSATAWVESSNETISALRAVYVEMQAEVIIAQDRGFRETMTRITDNYQKKLDAVTALHHAVSAGDTEAERDAQIALSQAASEGTAMMVQCIDRLRTEVDPDLLAAELRRKGLEMGALMNVQPGTLNPQ